MKLKCSWQARAKVFPRCGDRNRTVVVGGTNASNNHVHMTTDWSHKHLIYSKPKSLAKQIHYYRVRGSVQQQIRRNKEKSWWPWDEWRWRRASKNANRLHGGTGV